MHRTPGGGSFTLLAPPLQARMRNVMVEARAQALENFALNAKQRIEHQSLGNGRVEQREVSGRMRLRWYGHHSGLRLSSRHRHHWLRAPAPAHQLYPKPLSASPP